MKPSRVVLRRLLLLGALLANATAATAQTKMFKCSAEGRTTYQQAACAQAPEPDLPAARQPTKPDGARQQAAPASNPKPKPTGEAPGEATHRMPAALPARGS